MKQEDFFLPPNYFKKLGGVSEEIINAVLQADPTLSNSGGDIKVFAFFKELLQLQKPEELPNIDNMSILNQELLKEKLVSLKIANEIKMGNFISKIEAMTRIRDCLNAVKQHILLAINMYTRDLPDKRQVTQDLTIAYNKAISYLEKESDNVSWADEGDTESLVRARLQSLKEVDKQYEATL